jgi:Ser/Thr protein kinase RdoA (MazF antagonist)
VSTAQFEELIRARVLPQFPVSASARVEPLGRGLINQTFLVVETPTDGAPGRRFVLQRVSPLFPAAIHANIAAVTAALAHAGVTTPMLVPTHDARVCLQLDGDAPSVWRLMTHVPGVSFDVVASPAQARAAGTLIARFHGALDDLPHAFVGLREGVHDTARHLDRLRRAVADHPSHRLIGAVVPVAARILAAAAALPPLPALPARICHGDLKLNNVLFAGAAPPARDQAVCLVDLDTVGPLALAFELGDAWRSWCNDSGEDQPEAALNLEIFAASLDGYREGRRRSLGGDERRALLLGPEWISLELAARFAADALTESYFGWDPDRFAGRGEHNLVRARGQLSLHEAFVATRAIRARCLA